MTIQNNAASLIKAAVLVRISPDHPRYGTEYDAIRNYAAERRMEIVRTYTDEGAGASQVEHSALHQLITDVQAGRADFSAVLVYDASRWGRFQNPDESAYYESICHEAGIAIHTCDGQALGGVRPVSAIIKSMRRVMAAEFLREMSSMDQSQGAEDAQGPSGEASYLTPLIGLLENLHRRLERIERFGGLTPAPAQEFTMLIARMRDASSMPE